jgi:hypothetical protein
MQALQRRHHSACELRRLLLVAHRLAQPLAHSLKLALPLANVVLEITRLLQRHSMKQLEVVKLCGTIAKQAVIAKATTRVGPKLYQSAHLRPYTARTLQRTLNRAVLRSDLRSLLLAELRAIEYLHGSTCCRVPDCGTRL